MVVFTKIMVVELDKALDCFLHRTHLNQSHLAILLKELEVLDDTTTATKEHLEVIFNNGGWDVRQVQGR